MLQFVAAKWHSSIYCVVLAAGSAMINGDSETRIPFRHPVDKAAAGAAADQPSELQHVLDTGSGKRHRVSFPFNSLTQFKSFCVMLRTLQMHGQQRMADQQQHLLSGYQPSHP